jgi:hypothetical protein
MDHAILIVVGFVALAASFLADAAKEHPIGAALLVGIFVFAHIVSSERNVLIGQLRKELQDLERHIDS